MGCPLYGMNLIPYSVLVPFIQALLLYNPEIIDIYNTMVAGSSGTALFQFLSLQVTETNDSPYVLLFLITDTALQNTHKK